MIPKIIHYCWFSGEEKPTSIQNCIDSWIKFLPNFEIKCWDSDSFDFNSVPFVKEAIQKKKWAFASDYVRLYALYTEGGVYLDSDVQAFGSIEEWLNYDFFTGIETRDKAHTELYPEAAIMGSISGLGIIADAMSYYQNNHFENSDGSLNQTPIPTIMDPILKHEGWIPEDKTQLLGDNKIVFSTKHIANSNCDCPKTVKFYHWNNRSWIPMTRKQRFLISLKRSLLVKKIERILRSIIRKKN